MVSYHRSTKWLTRLSTMGPCMLKETSDHPIRELLVRSTILGQLCVMLSDISFLRLFSLQLLTSWKSYTRALL